MAVTGERLEFRVPAGVFTAMGLRDSVAVCFGDVRLLAVDAERRRTAKGSVGKAFGEMADAIYRDLARLEKAGTDVESPVPACMFRATGKEAARPRVERRTTAIHERFHADVRRAESRLGGDLNALGCGVLAREQLREELGTPAREALLAAGLLRWSPTLEEVLARAEEVRKACLRSDADCQETRARFTNDMARFKKAGMVGGVSDDVIPRFADAVVAQYGSPMGFVTQTLRVCAADGRAKRRG